MSLCLYFIEFFVGESLPRFLDWTFHVILIYGHSNASNSFQSSISVEDRGCFTPYNVEDRGCFTP